MEKHNQKEFFTTKNNLDLDFIKWLIDRHDRWRSSIIARASVLLSANAFLLAGLTFLVDKVLLTNANLEIVGSLIIATLGVGGFFLLLSLVKAMNGITNIWESSRQKFGPELPDRFYFHPSDTIDKSDSFEKFAHTSSEVDENFIYRAAMAELWTVICMHNYRYQNLKNSLKFLLIAVPFYIFAIVLVLFNSLYV